MGNTMSSYTYTDVSVGFFNEAAQLFRAYSDKMTFKVLDIEKAPASQGFEPHSYDVVIASNVLHATASLQRTLENTRQLLKPGGYLMLLELTNNGPVRFSNIMGGLSGWWAGVGDGRKYAPTITPGGWHTALRKAGFSGVEAITPEIDNLSWPFSIMAAQAVDDRVHFLRRPLSYSSSSTSIHLESLVILGTGSLESARIAEEVEEHLGRFCGQIVTLSGLPTEDEALDLPPMSTFINLVDIDAPIFKDMTAEKMDGLKRLYELAKHILWITVCARTDQPYHMASIAFSRAMSHEAGHISMNHLDLSDLEHNVSKIIAEYLLRQSALDEWEAPKDQHQQFLWSKEPEAFLDRGQLLIPRLVDNTGQNARLNSSRRVITKTVPTSSSDLSLALSINSSPVLVEHVLPVALKDNPSFKRVRGSSFMAINITTDTFLYLAIGKDEVTKDTVVLLSTTNSCTPIPTASVVVGASKITQSIDSLLIAIVSELLAASLVQTLSSGSSILVHCSDKDRFLAAALSRRAASKAVHVTFTGEAEGSGNARGPEWIKKLNVRLPRHVLRKTLLSVKPTHFLDLTAHSHTHPSDLSLSIAQVLPSGCKRISLPDIARHQSSLPLSSDPEALVGGLEDAVSNAKMAATSTTQEEVDDLVIRLEQIHDPSLATHTTSVVHWSTEGDVTVEVRPLDARGLFSQNKTYLLVGLTGQIGRSVCEWMVSHGAGCVCLTSRSPKINEQWLDSFQGTDATVKVFAMYVNKPSLLSTTQLMLFNDIGMSPTCGVSRGLSARSEPAVLRSRVWPMERWSFTTHCFPTCHWRRWKRFSGPKSTGRTILTSSSMTMILISSFCSRLLPVSSGIRVRLITPQRMGI